MLVKYLIKLDDWFSTNDKNHNAFQIISDREIGRLSVAYPESIFELGKIAGIRSSVAKVHDRMQDFAEQ